MVAAQSVVFGKMAIFCYSPALYTKLISSIICGFSDHYDHYEKKNSVMFIPRALAYFISIYYDISFYKKLLEYHHLNLISLEIFSAVEWL